MSLDNCFPWVRARPGWRIEIVKAVAGYKVESSEAMLALPKICRRYRILRRNLDPRSFERDEMNGDLARPAGIAAQAPSIAARAGLQEVSFTLPVRWSGREGGALSRHAFDFLFC